MSATTTDRSPAEVPADTWPVYSCDDHLDLRAVPTDLWESRLPAAMVDAGPRVVRDADGARWMVGDVVLGASGHTPGGLTAIERAGITDDGFRPSTPSLRLADMDFDGVFASVIYGPNLFGLPIQDQEVKSACWRAWNDWAAEFNTVAPERLSVLPVLPTHTPQAAAAELERVTAQGHRGALVFVYEFDPGDAAWNVLWATAQETGLPISFHIGGGTGRIQPAMDTWELAAYSSVCPIQLDEPLAAMVFSGALERHPGMRLVLAESGCGWVPYLVKRMDGAHEKFKGKLGGGEIGMRPSEIFTRQVWATFEEEPFGPELIPLLGADNFMWASDYPHPDSTFPNSRTAIHESLGALSMEERKKVTADNCRMLYKF